MGAPPRRSQAQLLFAPSDELQLNASAPPVHTRLPGASGALSATVGPDCRETTLLVERFVVEKPPIGWYTSMDATLFSVESNNPEPADEPTSIQYNSVRVLWAGTRSSLFQSGVSVK